MQFVVFEKKLQVLIYSKLEENIIVISFYISMLAEMVLLYYVCFRFLVVCQLLL